MVEWKKYRPNRGALGLALFVAALVALSLLAATIADARPGGGHSFSGGRSFGGLGGSSSRSPSFGGGYSSPGRGYIFYSGGSTSHESGSGGADNGWVNWFLLLVIFIIIISAWSLKGVRRNDGWDSASARSDYLPEPPSPAMKPRGRVVDLSPIRKWDPNFSSILLEDFLFGLYVRAQEARGAKGNALDLLAPYIAAEARGALGHRGERPVADVTGVVVGSLSLTRLTGIETEEIELVVLFESNYTEVYEGVEPRQTMGFYAKERWRLARSRSAKSRPPERIQTYNCPNCDAAVTQSQDERCAYCGAVFGSGELDWFVKQIVLLGEEMRGPLLTGFVEEEGTDNPTIKAADLDQQLAALTAKDSNFSLPSFSERITLIYDELNRAWTSLDWPRVRPYTSDRFFLSQLYWINAYKEQGLRNVLEKGRLEDYQLAKITQDPFFDAITVRLFARVIDYTIHEATRRVVGGKRSKERYYSEYWTFIRSAKTRGPARADKRCPNCGADLSINMAGHCVYCSAKVTSGEFDWVLSRIEQDEAYKG